MNKLVLGSRSDGMPDATGLPFVAVFLTDCDEKEEVYLRFISASDPSEARSQVQSIKSSIREYIKTREPSHLSSFRSLSEAEVNGLLSLSCDGLVYYALESFDSA